MGGLARNLAHGSVGLGLRGSEGYEKCMAS